MDHLNVVTIAAIKATIFTISFISLLTTEVITTGVVSCTYHAPSHPYTKLRHAYTNLPKEPHLVKSRQVVAHGDKAQLKPSRVESPLSWSDDLVNDPDFNASFSIDHLIGKDWNRFADAALCELVKYDMWKRAARFLGIFDY